MVVANLSRNCSMAFMHRWAGSPAWMLPVGVEVELEVLKAGAVAQGCVPLWVQAHSILHCPLDVVEAGVPLRGRVTGVPRCDLEAVCLELPRAFLAALAGKALERRIVVALADVTAGSPIFCGFPARKAINTISHERVAMGKCFFTTRGAISREVL